MYEFTESQKKCIETETKDILVSAGAGSGKTTVLAERIMRRIERGGDIRDFLVVTFTNAAAADLKEKLSARLASLSAARPENRALRRMLYSVSGADICTIDSFCLGCVRQNAAALGLTEGTAVGDETLCDALLNSAADEVLTSLCEDDEETASLLLDNFASYSSDKGLMTAVTRLYGRLRAYPFYMDWFAEAIAKHNEDEQTLSESGFFACKAGERVKAAIGKRLSAAAECAAVMEAEASNESQAKFADKVSAISSRMQTAFEVGYAAFCENCTPESLRRPQSTGAYVAAFEKWKKHIETAASYRRGEEELKTEYAEEGKVLTALYTFMEKLDDAYAAAKRERGILDFADTEHLMLSLLLTKTEGGYVKTGFCKGLQNAYSEIFIDEYQDVNPLQDAVFRAIGEGKRFMVGDVKQSIYGFRNAYPTFFTSFRDSFADVDEGAPTARIFLKENFRCDENIISFCNLLFDKVFTAESAGTDYKAERLVFGKRAPAGREPVRVTLYEKADIHKEAAYIAEEIVRLISAGTPPKDIAVLARNKEDIKAVGEALTLRGVPNAMLKSKTRLLTQPGVLLAISLLRVIDNPTDDISLAALLRSPIFRFTADDLFALRSGGSLYGDVCAAAGGSGRFVNARFRLKGSAEVKPCKGKPRLVKRAPEAVAEKCKAFLEKLRIYRTRALFMPANELLWYLYEDTSIFLYAPEGAEKPYKEDLFALLDMATSFESGVYKGAYAFVEYISRLEEADQGPYALRGAPEDSVRLTTVHGAKGLEFPIVFVCGCGGKMKKNSNDAVCANYFEGVSFKLSRQAKAWKKSTLLRDAARKAESDRSVAEEYRILYVAFTRARERLYVSAAISGEAEKYFAKAQTSPTYYADLFLHALRPVKDESFVFETVNAEDAEIPVTPLSPAEAAEGELPLPPIAKDSLPERVTAKYSVSTLKRLENGLLAPEEAKADDKRPVFASAADGASVGTANHLFLQFADFSLAEKDVPAEAKRLLLKGFITKEQYALLNVHSLGRFFRSALYLRLKASKRVYREKRFTTRVSASLFGENRAESVLLQGVIDCFFENEDGSFTLVDYKTDSAKPGDERLLAERHGTQLSLYADYIERLTGKKVREAYIYSLSLGKEIEVNTKGGNTK